MKIPVLLFAIICFSNTLIFGQQIPNGDFETWDTTLSKLIQPRFWSIQNDPELHLIQRVAGYEHGHAICLKVGWDQMLHTFTGASITSEFANTEKIRPTRFSGHLRGSFENTDSLYMAVSFYRDEEIVATVTAKLFTNSSQWKSFELPILYTSDAEFDHVVITIGIATIHAKHAISTYCIDGLNLVSNPPAFNDHRNYYLSEKKSQIKIS